MRRILFIDYIRFKTYILIYIILLLFRNLLNKKSALNKCFEEKLLFCPRYAHNMFRLQGNIEFDVCDGVVSSYLLRYLKFFSNSPFFFFQSYLDCKNSIQIIGKAGSCFKKLDDSLSKEQNCKNMNETVQCLKQTTEECPKLRRTFQLTLMVSLRLCPDFNDPFLSEGNPLYGIINNFYLFFFF